ncbi:MAG TPA: HlyD family secretion protein [Xanthobacteraceae bacterium]|nr:HlyD family secretion protein [Xanthobacteraceae bacterium]
MLFVPAESRQSTARKGILQRVGGAVGKLKSNRRRLRLTLMFGGAAFVAIAAAAFWLMSGRYVSTDNAYVHAAKLMVSTDISGIVSEVDVKEGQHVKKGEVLFRVDPEPFQIALDSAKAQLELTRLNIESMKQDYQRALSGIASQQAQVELAKANYERAAALVKSGSTSKANYDQMKYAYESGRKQLQALRDQAKVQLAKLGGDPNIKATEHPLYLQAKAKVDEAQRQLDDTVVRAPFGGVVTQVSALQPGTYLVAQTAALTNTGAVALVSTDNIWIEANMKETDLTHVKPGDKVSVSIDTYPDREWTGTVESISPATGAEFSILPAQNTSGNWVKVVQRITVRIKVQQHPQDPPLRAGMSAYVSIDTGHRHQLADLF